MIGARPAAACPPAHTFCSVTGDGGEPDDACEPGAAAAGAPMGTESVTGAPTGTAAGVISMWNCVPPTASSRVGSRCVTPPAPPAAGSWPRTSSICITISLIVASASGRPSSSTISRATDSGVSVAKSIGKVTVLLSPSMSTWHDSSIGAPGTPATAAWLCDMTMRGGVDASCTCGCWPLSNCWGATGLGAASAALPGCGSAAATELASAAAGAAAAAAPPGAEGAASAGAGTAATAVAGADWSTLTPSRGCTSTGLSSSVPGPPSGAPRYAFALSSSADGRTPWSCSKQSEMNPRVSASRIFSSAAGLDFCVTLR
mmetsp:Transcript_5110/g.11788  ORF Transcript_5110/g.11788 Transcript_5110/m.11788 type:complete len:316 (-) Transcript_5110:812-1759(-)